MADVLLTHSYHLPYDSKQLRKMQPYTPIGTLYAATVLRQRGISVALFDSMLEPPAEKLLALLRQRPKIVAVYEDDFNFLSKMCLTRMRQVAWDIAKTASEIGAVVVVHGSDSTDNPEQFLTNGFDYVLCGEAEEVLADLCGSILKGIELPQVDGVIRKSKHGDILGSPQRRAKNPGWAQLPIPSRELLDLEPYRAAWLETHGYFSTNMVASRGCPFRCNWCAKPISGDRFQLRNAVSVAEEMALLKRAGVDHIWFSDDVFALDHRWVAEFAEEVTRLDAALPFKVQSRADLLREDTVANLRTAGCDEVWIGVESGAQAILDAMNKGLKLPTVVAARQRLRDAGIRASFFLQLGYPGETWTELQETIAFVRTVRPDNIGISFSYPLPGTVFHERVRMQLGTKRNWTDSGDLCIMFKAAYTTDFYRAIRDALHAEVDSWNAAADTRANNANIESLWDKVFELEPMSRVADAFSFPKESNTSASSAIISIDALTGGSF